MGELIHALTSRLQASGERTAATLLGYGALSLLIVFAFAAFVYAAATALTQAYGAIVSASVIGIVALVLALLVFAWLAMRKRRLRREQQRMRRLAQPAVTSVAASLMPVMMRSNPLGALLLFAAAGYMLQRSTRRREET